MEDLTVSGVRTDTDQAGKAEWINRKIPEVPESYPEARIFGRLPTCGFCCRHVKGLKLREIEFKTAPKDERPAIFCDDVKDLEIAGSRSASIVGGQPVIKLVHTSEALIQSCVTTQKAKTVLGVQGSRKSKWC